MNLIESTSKRIDGLQVNMVVRADRIEKGY